MMASPKFSTFLGTAKLVSSLLMTGQVHNGCINILWIKKKEKKKEEQANHQPPPPSGRVSQQHHRLTETEGFIGAGYPEASH